MILTYRYRLLPTKAQHAALAAILEAQRRLYNDALAERIDAYRRSLLEVERGRRARPHTITFFDQTNALTTIRNDPLTREEFSRLPAFLQHWTLKRLDDAYKAFFRRVKAGAEEPGFPRFRGREWWSSFGSTVQGGNSPVSLGGRRIRIASRNWCLRLRAHVHRPLPEGAVLKAAVFTRHPGGRKWHVCLQCEVPELPQRCQSVGAAVGLDVGIATAIMQSDGGAVPLPQAIRRARKAERRLQRTIARGKRGSKRRAKARQRFADAKRKTAENRRQWQHKQTARLTRSYALVAAEDLTLANMTRSAKGTAAAPGKNVKAKAELNRSMLDGGLAGLVEKLAYKAERDGSRLVLVDPRYTSQRCSGCGVIDPKALDNNERLYQCQHCGLVLDRDKNAARNILALGLKSAVSSSFNAGWPVRAGQKRKGRVPRNTASLGLPDGGGNPATYPERTPEIGALANRAARPCYC